jgi:hypothetical protein
LVALTAMIVPMAVGGTIITIGSSSPAAVIMPDLVAVACIVALARRLRRPNGLGHKPQIGETWQRTR